MGLPQPIKRYTPLEYYTLEREAEFKSEYYEGEIFAMAGGTTRHSVIVTNLIAELHYRLKGKPCAAYESNQRLKIKASGLRSYPDVSIYCDPIEYDQEDPWSETAINPVVVLEVLSPSTESYDRGAKSANYRQIASLKAYVLVSQVVPRVELYTRQSNGAWLLTEAIGLDSIMDLEVISVRVPLADIYDRVSFPMSNAPQRFPKG